MTEWVHFLCCQISAWFSNTREAHDSGWHGTTLYYPPPVGNGTILGARSNMKNTRWPRKSSFLNVLHMIWWRLQGGSFSIPTLYCRLNWRQWFRRKQILEFTVYLQVRMEIGWTTHNFENCRLPGCGRLGPVSLPSLNAQWPCVALVSNNMIAYLMHNIFFGIRPCAWNAHPAPQAPNRLTM